MQCTCSSSVNSTTSEDAYLDRMAGFWPVVAQTAPSSLFTCTRSRKAVECTLPPSTREVRGRPSISAGTRIWTMALAAKPLTLTRVKALRRQSLAFRSGRPHSAMPGDITRPSVSQLHEVDAVSAVVLRSLKPRRLRRDRGAAGISRLADTGEEHPLFPDLGSA